MSAREGDAEARWAVGSDGGWAVRGGGVVGWAGESGGDMVGGLRVVIREGRSGRCINEEASGVHLAQARHWRSLRNAASPGVSSLEILAEALVLRRLLGLLAQLAGTDAHLHPADARRRRGAQVSRRADLAGTVSLNLT